LVQKSTAVVCARVGGCGARRSEQGFVDRPRRENTSVKHLGGGAPKSDAGAHKSRNGVRRGDTGVADQLLGGNPRVGRTRWMGQSPQWSEGSNS
jgi:hypothetical protein